MQNNGYIHRDIKPGNFSLVYYALKFKYKNGIFILDFGNSKILNIKDCALNFSNGKKGCFGSKCFSSNNSLLDKDVLPFN